MTTTAIVWLVVALVSITAVLAVLVGLIRHVIVIGRALARFQDEVGSVAAEVTEASRRTRGRSWGLRSAR